jgi:hypothetical protein
VLGVVAGVGGHAGEHGERLVDRAAVVRRQVRAEVARLHDPQAAAGGHEATRARELPRDLDRLAIRGRVAQHRMAAHDPDDGPRRAFALATEVAPQRVLDGVVVQRLGESLGQAREAPAAASRMRASRLWRGTSGV